MQGTTPSKPHEILGIAIDAPKDEIRRAYKRLAHKHHPDRGGDPAMFDQVNKAYKSMNSEQCPLCNGSGLVEVHTGAFVRKTKCLKCWRF